MELFGLRLEYLPAASTLQVEGRISVFEILSLLGIVAAIVSLIISVRTSQSHARTRRAEFSFRVWQAFMEDDVQKAYLDIEWGRFKYPTDQPNGFVSLEQEQGVDRLLYLLDEMALLIQSGVLSKSDRERWSYQGTRVLRNEQVSNYLAFLDLHFEQSGMLRRPHDAARKVFANKK